MSKFTDRVLQIINLVPEGQVVSYGQVALMAGVPRAAIQVGWVLHQNGDQVPWWRVINHVGHISTSCMEHTTALQKTLLEKEGIKVSKDLMVDMQMYRYMPDQKTLEKLKLDEIYVRELMDKYLV